MNANDLIIDIQAFCKANADENLAIKYKYYFKEEVEFHGIRAPQLHLKAKELVKQNCLDIGEVLVAARELLASEKQEEVMLFLLVFNQLNKQYKSNHLDEISKWFSFSIRNWAQADALAMFILPRFIDKKLVGDEFFQSWLTSVYRFQRRCVPVTFLKTLKKRESFQSLFEMNSSLMMDPERVVQQGIGWFLRECWKKRSGETSAFLMKWKDQAPRLIIRYAIEKMSPEQKILYRKS